MLTEEQKSDLRRLGNPQCFEDYGVVVSFSHEDLQEAEIIMALARDEGGKTDGKAGL